jgi:hypothetical protein
MEPRIIHEPSGVYSTAGFFQKHDIVGHLQPRLHPMNPLLRHQLRRQHLLLKRALKRHPKPNFALNVGKKYLPETIFVTIAERLLINFSNDFFYCD